MLPTEDFSFFEGSPRRLAGGAEDFWSCLPPPLDLLSVLLGCFVDLSSAGETVALDEATALAGPLRFFELDILSSSSSTDPSVSARDPPPFSLFLRFDLSSSSGVFRLEQWELPPACLADVPATTILVPFLDLTPETAGSKISLRELWRRLPPLPPPSLLFLLFFLVPSTSSDLTVPFFKPEEDVEEEIVFPRAGVGVVSLPEVGRATIAADAASAALRGDLAASITMSSPPQIANSGGGRGGLDLEVPRNMLLVLTLGFAFGLPRCFGGSAILPQLMNPTGLRD